jgi:hypothetical protein
MNGKFYVFICDGDLFILVEQLSESRKGVGVGGVNGLYFDVFPSSRIHSRSNIATRSYEYKKLEVPSPIDADVPTPGT